MNFASPLSNFIKRSSAFDGNDAIARSFTHGKFVGNDVPTSNQTKQSTRTKIINCAEECFATFGYHGTSIRKIAHNASLKQAHIYYYFKSKDELYEAVVIRHTDNLAAERKEHLSKLTNGSSVRDIMCALIIPLMSYITQHDRSHRHFGQLLNQLIADPDPRAIDIVERHLDPLALLSVEQLKRALPNYPPKVIVWALLFSVSVILSSFDGTGRAERLSKGKCNSRNFDEVVEVMVPFIVGGFSEIGRSLAKKN